MYPQFFKGDFTDLEQRAILTDLGLVATSLDLYDNGGMI